MMKSTSETPGLIQIGIFELISHDQRSDQGRMISRNSDVDHSRYSGRRDVGGGSRAGRCLGGHRLTELSIIIE